MNSTLPFALIIGIDHFVAKKLAEELSKKDINVVGVGDYVSGLGEIKNFEWVMDLSEIKGKFNYVFDFVGDSDIWQTEQFRGEKITIICVNEEEKAKQIKNEVDSLDLNWRLIEAGGVYGPGMKENNFLTEALRMAVVNKNLVLPETKTKFRVLVVDDLVEAILRASFLSGTEKEKFLIMGEKIDSEEVAKVLIDAAKMTRYKVMQKEIDFEKVDERKLEETKKKLRWEAKIDFKTGVTEILQYFFSVVDEESRRKKVAVKETKKEEVIIEKKEEIKKEVKKREFEVVVEDDETGKIKDEKVLEEIENFYKQKKSSFEVEKIKPIEKEEEEKKEEILESFDQIFEEEEVENKEEIKEEIKKEIVVGDKKRKSKWKMILLFLIFFLILVVPINWTISTVLATRNIRDNLILIENKKYKQVEELAEKNLTRIRKIDGQIDSWGLNKISFIRNYQTLLKIGIDVLKLEKKSIEISRGADLMSEAIFKDRQINFVEELEKQQEYLINFENELGLILARLNGDYSWLPSKWRISLQKQAGDLKTIKDKLALISRTMELMPEILGLDGKRRDYLVLFQNEAELRATGGFIGSYGILSFQNGKMLSFEVEDVYEADGQLKGHIEPPIEIKTHLNQPKWYMRDANWNPDFVKSAADIQWFLNEEVKKKVNGVIGMNLAVARSIVEVAGEVFVPNFDRKITKDNLYEEAEYYSENKFFPGSQQKASFLGTLGKQLMEEIKELKAKDQLVLVMSLIDLLEKNELQLAFNDRETALMVKDLGWDGSIYNGKCLKENCFEDYLFVVESNFGVNKSNYFLQRSIEQMVDISNNSVGRVLKINYENKSRENKAPEGNYKNYLRVYLPVNVNLSQISLTDGINSNIKKVYAGDELRIRDINGKKEIGFLVEVPIMSKKILEIRYSSENNLANKNKFSYVNYIQRQSGFGDTGLVSLVSFPDNWQPTDVRPQASVVAGKLLFNQKLDRDINIGVELGR